jgi:cytochrome c biogenesis protein CcmG/thiol:disulfide interchange protein DsbE
MRTTVVALGLLLAACSPTAPAGDAEPPVPITSEEINALLEASTEPVVLNVWASWCVPCRSEAPLLSRASNRFATEVRVIGLDVRDTESGAAAFIAEFYADAAIEHFSDRAGHIPIQLGGTRGVPLTFFFNPGGELNHLHYGVIDERTLALQIDELVNR